MRKPLESTIGKDLPTAHAIVVWLCVGGGLLALWEWASRESLIHTLVSRPSFVVRDFVDLALHGTNVPIKGALWEHFVASARRVYVGIAIGALVGFPLACLAMTIPIMRSGLRLILPAAATTPRAALVYLFIVFFGIYELPKYAVGIWTAFLFQLMFVYQHTERLLTTQREILNAAEEFTGSRWCVIRYVLGPLLLPAFFDAVFLANASLWALLVVTEEVNARQGIGAIFAYAYETVQISMMISSMILLSICGMITGWAIDRVKRKVIWW